MEPASFQAKLPLELFTQIIKVSAQPYEFSLTCKSLLNVVETIFKETNFKIEATYSPLKDCYTETPISYKKRFMLLMNHLHDLENNLKLNRSFLSLQHIYSTVQNLCTSYFFKTATPPSSILNLEFSNYLTLVERVACVALPIVQNERDKIISSLKNNFLSDPEGSNAAIVIDHKNPASTIRIFPNINFIELNLPLHGSFLTHLVLNSNKMVNLPFELGELSSLEHLDISQNNFQGLPIVVCSLKNLKTLIIDQCQVKNIPQRISHLSKLQFLSLQNNCLTSIPSEIGSLSELTHLIVSNNKIASVAIEIFTLEKLHYLNLRNNHLHALPPEIAHLEKLKQLCISNNPKLILSKMDAYLNQLNLECIYMSLEQFIPLSKDFFKNLEIQVSIETPFHSEKGTFKELKERRTSNFW